MAQLATGARGRPTLMTLPGDARLQLECSNRRRSWGNATGDKGETMRRIMASDNLPNASVINRCHVTHEPCAKDEPEGRPSDGGNGSLNVAVDTFTYAASRQRLACAPWCATDVPVAYSTRAAASTEAVRNKRRTLQLPEDLHGRASRPTQ